MFSIGFLEVSCNNNCELGISWINFFNWVEEGETDTKNSMSIRPDCQPPPSRCDEYSSLFLIESYDANYTTVFLNEIGRELLVSSLQREEKEFCLTIFFSSKNLLKEKNPMPPFSIWRGAGLFSIDTLDPPDEVNFDLG
jgi:hypothetical protein